MFGFFLSVNGSLSGKSKIESYSTTVGKPLILLLADKMLLCVHLHKDKEKGSKSMEAVWVAMKLCCCNRSHA